MSATLMTFSTAVGAAIADPAIQPRRNLRYPRMITAETRGVFLIAGNKKSRPSGFASSD